MPDVKPRPRAGAIRLSLMRADQKGTGSASVEGWKFTGFPLFCVEPQFCSGDLATRFAMTSRSSIRRLSAPLVAFFLTIWPLVSPVHAVDAAKVGVVAFGLFGDQGVFRSEATGAAEVVAGRFETTGPIDVEYNSKEGGSATIETLTTSLQAAAKRMDAEKDVLFSILTSHGSPSGLAIKAGQLTETLTPTRLRYMLAKTGVRHKVVVIWLAIPGFLSVFGKSRCAGHHRGRCQASVVRLPRQRQVDLFWRRLFQRRAPERRQPE